MKCQFEIENKFPNNLSFEEIQEIICQKIARIIVKETSKKRRLLW